MQPSLDFAKRLSIIGEAVGHTCALEGHGVKAAVVKTVVEIHLELAKLKLDIKSGFPEGLFTCPGACVVFLDDTL